MINVLPHKIKIHFLFQRCGETDVAGNVFLFDLIRADVFIDPLKSPCQDKEDP